MTTFKIIGTTIKHDGELFPVGSTITFEGTTPAGLMKYLELSKPVKAEAKPAAKPAEIKNETKTSEGIPE